ncbi:MAG: RIP metalloprotease RseP [Steroidobacteraceae bacterium]
MNISWTQIVGFIVAICVLVSVHEYGHFWVARRLGFKVLRFSVGFGKALWKRTARDGTEYQIAAIPLGGYVKLLDEREGPVPPEQLSRAFTRRPHWQRIAVLLAGPAFNIIFAVLVLTGMYLHNGTNEVRARVGEITAQSPMAQAGLRSDDEIVSVDGKPVAGQGEVFLGLLDGISARPTVNLGVVGADGQPRSLQVSVPDATQRRQLTEPARLLEGLGLHFYEPPIPPVLGEVQEGPASRAGLKSGDEILAFNGAAVSSFQQLVTLIRAHPAEQITLRYRRDGHEDSVRLTTESDQFEGRTIGRIKVAQQRPAPAYPDSMLRHQDLGLWGAFQHANAEAWNMTALQARLMWRMLTGQVSVKNLNGPLSIAQYAGDSVNAGPTAFLGFLVMISLALGFMNLLPIPILDGGQIVMQSIEWIKGRPLSERAQILGQQLGIAMLMALMGVALFNDIVRQFG